MQTVKKISFTDPLASIPPTLGMQIADRTQMRHDTG